MVELVEQVELEGHVELVGPQVEKSLLMDWSAWVSVSFIERILQPLGLSMEIG